MLIEGFVLPLRKIEVLRNVLEIFFRSTFFFFCRLWIQHIQIASFYSQFCPPETLAIAIQPNVLQTDIDSKAVLTFRQAGHIRGPAKSI